MRLSPLVLLLLLVLLPAAEAYPQPQLLFLRDGSNGVAEDGLLEAVRPTNPQPGVRAVLPADAPVDPARFLTKTGAPHPDRLRGPAYVGLWLGPSPVAKGNLTIQLDVINGTEVRSIATAQLVLDANASKAPQPTAVVPPTPTDPPSAANHIATQLLPVITPPATLVYMGQLDVHVGPAERVAVSFHLSTGSSPAPLAAGAAGSIQYNGSLQPSFVYLPWYAPDPEPTVRDWTPPPRATITASVPQPGETGRPAAAPNGTPAPLLPLVLVAVAAIVLAMRRRS